MSASTEEGHDRAETVPEVRRPAVARRDVVLAVLRAGPAPHTPRPAASNPAGSPPGGPRDDPPRPGLRPASPTGVLIRSGPTTLGLWGRVTSTAIVLFFLPWGPFTFVTVLYLVAYMPIAAILLATIWRRDVIGPIETSSVAHTVSTLATIRVCASAVGIALVGVALVAGAGPLGYVPSAPFLLVAVWPGAAEGFDEGIEEAKARPLGALAEWPERARRDPLGRRDRGRHGERAQPLRAGRRHTGQARAGCGVQRPALLEAPPELWCGRRSRSSCSRPTT